MIFFLLSLEYFIGTDSEILFLINTVFKNCNSCIIERKLDYEVNNISCSFWIL